MGVTSSKLGSSVSETRGSEVEPEVEGVASLPEVGVASFLESVGSEVVSGTVGGAGLTGGGDKTLSFSSPSGDPESKKED